MILVADLCRWLEKVAPPVLAADWDNVGLLLGDRSNPIRRIMTCLTVVPQNVDEAKRENVDLMIAHHPLPFRPLKRLTTDSPASKLIWNLATSGISLYSPHTAWDNCQGGINEQLANRIGLSHIAPLVENRSVENSAPNLVGCGDGRVGQLDAAITIEDLAERTASSVPHCQVRIVSSGRSSRRIGIVCGSGGSFVEAARRAGCDTLVTGEATFHQCLEAEAVGLNLLLLGHFGSERFALETLAERISADFPDLAVWASRSEVDPIKQP